MLQRKHYKHKHTKANQLTETGLNASR